MLDYLSDISEQDVFGGIVASDNPTPEEIKTVSNNIRLFRTIFTKNVFKEKYYVIYEAIMKISKLNTVVTNRQFKSAVTNSLPILIRIPEVQVEQISEADSADDQMRDLLQCCLYEFAELQKKPADEGLFKANLALLAERIKQNRYQEILLESYQIATKGEKVKGKYVQGQEAADKYYNREIVTLNAMVVDGQSKGMAIKSGIEGLQEVLSNMETLAKKPVCSFHLDPIDETVGELKTTELISIFGPPKGGKTRVTAGLVHDALMRGNDVCIFQLEGTPIEYVSMLEARHMLYMYGSNPVTDEMILDNKIPQEWRNRYEKCRADLYTNPKHGEFYIQPGPLYLETMEEQVLDLYYSWRPFTMLVIDYPTLAMSNSNKTEREIVANVFRKTKNLITFGVPGGMLGVLPHQMQTESFKKLKEGQDDEKRSKRSDSALDSSGGADSAESVKSPDLVMAVFSDKEMKTLNQMKLIYVAARRKTPFQDFKVRTIMGQCTLIYDETLEMQDIDL